MTAHFRTWGGHFAYVVNIHINNAVKSRIRAIFAYTAFTPFRVGMGELTSFPWRNGGQITAYRWYRQRAEKSYFFLSLSIAQIQTHCNKKIPLSVSTERWVDNFTIGGYTGNRKKGALPVDGYALRNKSKMTAKFESLGRSFCICSENPCEECNEKHRTQHLLIQCVHPLPGWNEANFTSFLWRNGGQ